MTQTKFWHTVYVGFSSAQQYKPPIGKVLKEQLNLTLKEFAEECKKNKGESEELIEDRNEAHATAYALADYLVKKAKKLPEVNERNWDELIEDRCLENPALHVENDFNVDNLNTCLDESKKLKGEKKIDFAKALLEAYCSAVKDL